mgnify:CR=1 FL=1
MKIPYDQLEICGNCSKTLSKIFEISQKISASLNQDIILREVCKAVIKEFGFKMVWIGVITPDSFDVKPVYQEGFEEGYLSSIKVKYDESPLGMGPTGTAIRTKTPSVINDYESDPRFTPWLSEAKKRGYKSGCAFPMIALEKVMGSINVYSDRKHGFDSNTIMLLQLLANNAAIALHNAHLYGELKDMEKRYHSLIENSPDAIGIILDRKIAFLNDLGLRLFEYTKDEIIGKDVSELVHPEDREMVLNHIDTVLSEGCAPPLEYRVLTKNGDIIHVETSRCRIEYEGKPAVQCIVRDIAERKKRDKRLKEMEERYRNLVEGSPDGIAVICDGKIVFANKRGPEILGYTTDELIDKSPLEYIHPEDREKIINTMKAILSGEILPPLREYRAIKKDGEVVEVEASSSKIIYEGKPAIQSIFRDVSERKKHEKKLKEMEERYRSLVENSPDAIGAVCNGRIVFINDKGLEMFGYKRDEIMGMDVAKTVSTEDRERVLNDIKIVLSGGHIPPREYKLLKKNGDVLNVEITRSKIEYEGKPAIQSTIRDISERKKRDSEMIEYVRELEILNKVAVERELRMIELKKEVNKLLIEIGRENRYKITE